ncbi:NUDIX domain-containing protein [Candidatus Microgenomates bacterium]|nr:NUDIX domain-containing protein [Candidatus Microgenomates bacterium]
MHRLQRHILHKLVINQSAPYSRIKPPSVEGNLFTYHLRHLISEDLVVKRVDGKYELTSAGKRLAEGISLETMTPRRQAKIVTLIACRDQQSRWLLYRRKRQPLIGMVGFPYGKIHHDEQVATAANRELQEKTGLTAKLTHRGDGYITISQGDEIISQILFHLFYGEDPTGKLRPENKVGKPYWQKLESYRDPMLMPSMKDLITAIDADTPGRFFCELAYNL